MTGEMHFPALPELQLRLPLNAKITRIETNQERDIPRMIWEAEGETPDTKTRTFYIERETPVFARLMQFANLDFERSVGMAMVHATEPDKRLRYLGKFECKEPAFVGHVFELIETE